MSGALILFLVSNLFPLVSLKVGGVEQETTLLGTSLALWQHGSEAVAVVVFLVSFLVPMMIMGVTLHVLVSIRYRLCLPFTRRLLAFLSHLHPWEMGDVYIVSMLVAMVKLINMARIIVDDGFYALAGAVVLAIAARAGIETWLLWRLLEHEEATVAPMPGRPIHGEGVS
jgi:paraquat-inducible protein A